MNLYFLAAGGLALLLGLAHSVLGERMILRRLGRGEGTPLSAHHMAVLRSTWHLVTLFGVGWAALFLWLGWSGARSADVSILAGVLAATFLAAAVYWLLGTRGRHLAWVVLAVMATLAWLAGAA